MTRMEALEAVAAAARTAARTYVNTGANHQWVQDRYADLCAAIHALDALPAEPEPARGEVVEVGKIVSMVTGRDADDVCLEYAVCSDGTAWLLQWEDCQPIGWKQLPPIPTPRLPLTVEAPR